MERENDAAMSQSEPGEPSYEDIGRLFAGVRKVETDLRILEKRYDELERRKDELKRSIQDKQYVELRDAERKMMDVVVLYSQRETLALVGMMHKHLPQELRDIIYRHYWNLLDDAHVSNGEASTKAIVNEFDVDEYSTKCIHESIECECLIWDKIPTAVLPAFVGEKTATEAAMELFRDSAFWSKILRIGIGTLNTFLEKDPLRLGIRVENVIRSLDIYGGFNVLRTQPYQCSALSRKNMTNVEVWLQRLLCISNKDKLVLFLTIECSQSVLDMERFLELFRKTYFDLQKAGCHDIGFKCLSKHHCWCNGEVGDRAPFLGDYYCMPLLEWREKYSVDEVIQAEHVEHQERGFNESATVDE